MEEQITSMLEDVLKDEDEEIYSDLRKNLEREGVFGSQNSVSFPVINNNLPIFNDIKVEASLRRSETPQIFLNNIPLSSENKSIKDTYTQPILTHFTRNDKRFSTTPNKNILDNNNSLGRNINQNQLLNPEVGNIMHRGSFQQQNSNLGVNFDSYQTNSTNSR
jgi:hypothetical protein